MSNQLSLFNFQDASITIPDPRKMFLDENSKLLFTIDSSTIRYNRELFTEDSFDVAAKKIFDQIIKLFDDTLCKGCCVILQEQNKNCDKYFNISFSGINHNYELDIWHWWFVHTLSKMIREKYKPV